ncbi:hypothetical protein L6R53_06030 [Myxococcota bacterium]|nr:hypothetical protein [Myxococcota bacterium]
MIPWTLLGLLAAQGCGGGLYEPTRVEGVRVVALVAEPPEARPRQYVRATIWVGKPDDRDLDVMLWTCTYLEDGSCAEAQFATEVEQWVTLGTDVDGQMETERQIPQEAEDWLDSEDEVVQVQLFAFACPKDECAIIGEVEAAMDEVGIDPGMAEKLADPTSWLARLPMDEVSLLTRGFAVSLREPGRVNRNPVAEARFAEALDPELVVAPGGVVDLAFHVQDPNGETVYAYPLTTHGRFEERKVKVEDQQVRLYLQAPAEEGEGRVWVIFDDRDGGLAVYSQPLRIQAPEG